jgi:hypothetical protein
MPSFDTACRAAHETARVRRGGATAAARRRRAWSARARRSLQRPLPRCAAALLLSAAPAASQVARSAAHDAARVRRGGARGARARAARCNARSRAASQHLLLSAAPAASQAARSAAHEAARVRRGAAGTRRAQAARVGRRPAARENVCCARAKWEHRGAPIQATIQNIQRPRRYTGASTGDGVTESHGHAVSQCRSVSRTHAQQRRFCDSARCCAVPHHLTSPCQMTYVG